MSTMLLMANPKAQTIYLEIDNTTPPAICADRYKLAKLAGDRDTMLAYECHIREMAQLHFNRADVLEALQSMERSKRARKMGKSGSKDLKSIARQLRACYAIGAVKRLEAGQVQFTIDGLTIRCKDLPGAVEQVACKYERGVDARNWRK